MAVGLTDRPAFAQSLTIQGKVANSANTPITGSAVQFRVQIRSPNTSNCVLFDETHTLDLSTTNGLFSVSINDGSGTVNAPSTYTLEQAVSNRAAFNVNSSYCAAGSGVVTYTPGDGDNRKVIISFYDPGSMSGFEQIPEMDLNPMAFAMEARTVGGYPATSLLRVDTAGAPGLGTVFTSGQAAELALLANGTSTKYTPASATNGAQIPTFSSDPTSPPAGSIWYNSTTGELHYRTSGGTQVVGAGGGGGGTITAITVSGGLTGGGSSGSVNVALPSGTSGQVLRHNGGNWGGYNFGLPDLLSTSLGSAVVSAACTAGQTMYYDSTAKELKCQSVGLASADIAGTLPVSHGGTGLSAGTVGAIPYFSSTSALSLLAAGSNGDVLTMNGSGVPVWQSLPASSFTGSGTANRLAKFTGASAVGNSILTDDGTNVGIGTTAPVARLEVAGSLRLADGGESCSAGANVGMMKYSGGSLFFCNASGWQTLGVSGAGLTSLNGLTANTQTFAIGSAGTSPAWVSAGSVHTLNLPAASASNTGLLSSADWSTFNGKLGTGATFAGDVTGTYNANVVTALRGVGIDTTAPAPGQVLKLGTSTWGPSNLTFGDVKTTGGTATLGSAVCNAGQTMYYDSSTGDLKCQAIAVDNASVTGTLAVAHGGTGASSTSQSYVFAGPAAGSGAPSFRALTAADISGLNTYWTSVTGGINYAGGNVGVGSTAPGKLLDLVANGADSNSMVRVTNGNAGSGVNLGYSMSNGADTATLFLQGTGQGRQLYLDNNSPAGFAFRQAAATGDLDFQTGTTPTSKFRISNSGNVGIGTTIPSTKLEVANSTSAVGIKVTNAGGDRLFLYDDGNAHIEGTTGSQLWINGSTTASTFINNGGGSTYINPGSGNVGIGTTFPASKLDVSGTLRVADGGEACSGGTNGGMVKYSGSSLYFCNGTAWQQLGVSGAGLTSLNGLTGSSQTFAIGSAGTAPAWSSSGSVHTLNLPTASASNTGILSSSDWSAFNGKLGTGTVFAGDVTGTYNATVVTKLQGVAVGTTAPTSGQFLKYGGSSWAPATLGFADLKTTGGAATMASAVCNAGQTMYFDTSTGDLKCQSIALGNASISGILPIANGGTGASTTSQNYVLAGPTSGSGAPSFRALTAGDLPASASYWQAATGGIQYSSGSVGIGTTVPGVKLDVIGGIHSGARLGVETSISGVTLPTQGAYVAWNENNGVGATNFMNHPGSGGGGFDFSLFNASGAFVSTPMTINGGGYVGIGTTSPSAPLHVQGTAGGGETLRLSAASGAEGGQLTLMDNTGAGGWEIDNSGTGSSATFRIFRDKGVNNTFGFLINSSGNIGMGTTAPLSKLHLGGPGDGTAALKITDPLNPGLELRSTSAGTPYIDFAANSTSEAGTGTPDYGARILYSPSASSGLNLSSGSGSLLIGNNGTSYFPVSSVGIGTSSPGSALDVNGEITAHAGSGGQGVKIYGRSSDNFSWGPLALSNNGASYTGGIGFGATAMTFNVGSSLTQAMAILTNGNVGIGSGTPNYILDVNGTASINAIQGGRTNGSGNFHLDAWSSGGTRGIYLNWYGGTGGVYVGNGSSAGYGQITASAFNTASDRTLKTNIEPITDALERLNKITGVRYDWKDKKMGSGRQVGVIAQDVQQVYPELVQVNKSNGKLSVNYAALVAPVLQAVKELYAKYLDDHAEIARLKAQNEALSRDVASLKALVCQDKPKAPGCQVEKPKP